MLRLVVSSRNKEICLIRKITGTQTYLCKTKHPKENPEQKCYIIKTRSEKHNMKDILFESDLLKAANKKKCLQNAQDAKRNECPNALEKLVQKVKEMLKFELLEQQFSEKLKIIIKKQIFVQQKIQNRLNSIIFKKQLPSKQEIEAKSFEQYHNQFGDIETITKQPPTIPELALKNLELIRLSFQKEAIKNWDFITIYYKQNIPRLASKNWQIVKIASKNTITELSIKNVELIKSSFRNTPDMAAKGWKLVQKSYYFRYMKQVPFMMIENSKIALIYADAYYQIFMQSQFKAEMVKILILTYYASRKATIKILILLREAINAYIEKNPPTNLLKKK